MADTQAQYFHSTLYAFSGAAVEAVIGKLHEVVNNVAVKCHYDRELDGFALTCPQSIGPDANDALHGAICAYVEGELEAAEREEREPLAVRFQKSVVDVFEPFASSDADDDASEVPEEEVRVTEDTVPAQVLLDPFKTKASFLHSVSADCGTSTVKMFNLRDTGQGMLERTLVHPGFKVQQAVFHGFTCRAARWDPAEGYFAFNGRSGKPIESDKALIEENVMSTCDFTVLLGQSWRQEAATGGDQEMATAKAKYWKFQGDVPSINQYLEHMGRTEFVDPNTAKDSSELPSDALKYNAAPEYDVRPVGRLRVPAPAGDDVDEEEDQPQDESTDDSDETASSAESESSAGAANPILNKFRNATMQPAPVFDETGEATSASQVGEDASTPRANVTSFGSATNRAQPQLDHTAASAHTTTLPDSNPAYAKVDKNGLTGNAGLQAQWEHANPSPSPKKLNKRGITRRAPTHMQDLPSQPTSASSTAMSLSTGPELSNRSARPSPSSSFSIAPPIAMLDDGSDSEPEAQQEVQPPKPELWANRKQRPDSVIGSLVDVSVTRPKEPDGRVRPPPGYGQSFQKTRKAPTRSDTVKPSMVKPEDEKLHDLIDLSWEEPARTKPSMKVSWKDAPLEPTVRLPKDPSLKPTFPVVSHPIALLDEDEIVERLQDTTNQSPVLRSTMRQKAAKKKKTHKTNTATPMTKVQLPMPSPPPPPKPTTSKRKTAVQDAGLDDGQAQQDVSIEKLKETHIEKLLRQVESLHGRQDVALQVSFGKLVVRPKDNSLCRKNWSAAKLQQKLQREEVKGELRTDFFERLTTSATDAAFMFDLLPSDDTYSKVEYEITIRLLQGETRIIKFDQKDPESLAVFCPEQTAVTLYMHYPVRVHDGRSRVIRSEFAPDVDSEKVASFVSSFHSVDNAPSFMATMPTPSFNVERVHVKRIFAKQIVPGVELKVEEIQDLKLDPVDKDKNFNLRATAANREFMIDNHRLWYECSLHLAPLGGVQGSVLQDLVDQMVAEIDGVGFHNKGPYLKTDIEEEPEAEVKFW